MGLVVNVLPDVFMGRSPIHGKGVFAGKAFVPGEVILEFQGKMETGENFFRPFEGDEMWLQVGANLFMGPSGKLDDLVNHSCDPNSAVTIGAGKVILSAIRKIEALEEIAYDYALLMAGDPWTRPCRCGSPICRGIIAEYRTLPAERRRQYEEMGIVPYYVMVTATPGR